MKMKLTLCFLLSFIALAVSAQITIGIDEPPVPGALLQIKGIPNINGNEANSTKGLQLPLVTIKSLTITSGNDVASTIDGITPDPSNPWEPLSHTGLVVFHTKGSGTSTIENGVYVWTGSEWLQVKITP